MKRLTRFVSLFMIIMLLLSTFTQAYAVGINGEKDVISSEDISAVTELIEETPASKTGDGNENNTSSDEFEEVSTDEGSSSNVFTNGDISSEEKVYASGDIASDDDTSVPFNDANEDVVFEGNDAVMPLANEGESGSGTGSATGGSTSSPGTGTLQFSMIGVTVQVVTYPYGESYHRNNSWQNITDTAKNFKTSSGVNTVYDGISITSNTFVGDKNTGRIFKLPNLNVDSKSGRLIGSYYGSISVHPVEHPCVTVEMDGWPSTGSNVSMPAANKVEKFLQRIIFGNNYGAWSVDDIALDANGNSLVDYSSSVSSYLDVSTFARTLRYLGCSEDLINNYVKGYTGQLSVVDDYDTPIPSIIWSYVMVESNNQGNLGRYPNPKTYLYSDSGSPANGIYFNAASYGFLYYYNVYTVGDIGVYSGSLEKFNEWWKTSYPLGTGINSDTYSGFNNIVGGCRWNDWTSFACVLLFGTHYHSNFFNSCLMKNAMIGSGWINSINADGVDSSSGNQYYFRGYWTPYGDIDEKSAYPFSITKTIDASDDCIDQIKNNSMYSLAGALYEVSINGTVVETLTTDANGYAVSAKQYDAGTVIHVKEIKAPKGFKLNKTTYTFTIGPTNNFSVKDEPVFDPPFAITKVDKDTTNAQGDTSFSGAVFKWEYFPNTDWSGEAERTWYFSTNANGYSYYDKDYLVSGYESDELYVNSDGINIIPLGTIRITEVLNSLGYIVLKDPLYCSVNVDSSSVSGAKVIWEDASLEHLMNIATGNYGVYEPIDPELFGSISLSKVDAVTGSSAQGGATLEGAKFNVINNSTNSVKIGDFDEAEPGEVCFEFYTDANGRFESEKIFPLGSYTVVESSPPTGYTLNDTWSESFTVTTSEQEFAFTCSNMPIMGGIRIVKTDFTEAENTGSDALFSGITFSVISENEQAVVVNDVTYEKGDVVFTSEILWNGSQWIAETGDNVLPYGSYTVRENPAIFNSELANKYYTLNANDQTVQVAADQTVVDVNFVNTIRVGKIEIEKVNLMGHPLEGAKFLLEWSEDGIAWQPVTYSDGDYAIKGACGTDGLNDGWLVTDETGIIVFENLHPGVQYRVTELEAPEGYVLLPDYAFVGKLPEDSMEVELTVVNSQGYELPASGSNDASFLASLGAFSACICVIFVITLLSVRYFYINNGNSVINKIYTNKRKDMKDNE